MDKDIVYFENGILSLAEKISKDRFIEFINILKTNKCRYIADETCWKITRETTEKRILNAFKTNNFKLKCRGDSIKEALKKIKYVDKYDFDLQVFIKEMANNLRQILKYTNTPEKEDKIYFLILAFTASIASMDLFHEELIKLRDRKSLFPKDVCLLLIARIITGIKDSNFSFSDKEMNEIFASLNNDTEEYAVINNESSKILHFNPLSSF